MVQLEHLVFLVQLGQPVLLGLQVHVDSPDLRDFKVIPDRPVLMGHAGILDWLGLLA